MTQKGLINYGKPFNSKCASCVLSQQRGSPQWGVPIRSLGSASKYPMIFFVAIIFYCSFILSESWKITRTWHSVRQLLVFLDRMALRRTLSALHGFSWGNVWKMSGNVLDVRYKLLSRQLDVCIISTTL